MDTDKNEVQLGQEALDRGDFIQALAHFKRGYEEKPSFHLNRRQVLLLAEAGEFAEALELAREWQEKYVGEPKAFKIYFTLLLQNQRFIAAHKQLAAVSEGDLGAMQSQLQTAEDYAAQFPDIGRRQTLEALEHIAEYEPSQQLMLVKNMSQLTFNEYLKIAAELLSNTAVNYFGRARIIEELVQLGVDQRFEMIWFNGERKSFRPSQLTLPEKNQHYQLLVEALKQQLENQNPSLLPELLAEVRLHFAVLYPFADDYITDPQAWAEAYISSYLHPEEAPGQEAIKVKIAALQQFIFAQGKI